MNERLWLPYFVELDVTPVGQLWPVYIVEMWERNEIGETRFTGQARTYRTALDFDRPESPMTPVMPTAELREGGNEDWRKPKRPNPTVPEPSPFDELFAASNALMRRARHRIRPAPEPSSIPEGDAAGGVAADDPVSAQAAPDIRSDFKNEQDRIDAAVKTALEGLRAEGNAASLPLDAYHREWTEHERNWWNHLIDARLADLP